MTSQQQRNTMPDRSRPVKTTTALSIGENQDGSVKLTTGKLELEQPFYNIKLSNAITTIRTWNVRTLRRCGKINELTNELERYKWNIICFYETRLTGPGEILTETGHKLYYSGQSKHFEGVGFIIKKDFTKSVMNYSAVSSRIMSIRIKANPMNISIIQIYAPTTTHEDQEIEDFYESIEEEISKTPKKDFLIIQGDWNAKVGKDATWNGCVGRFGTGSMNERGQRLLEFAERHKLVIANTVHPHKDSRITTWHSPNGLVHNQIDYIMTPKRLKSSIIRSSTRTYPGADVNSDHDLVMCNLRLKLRSNKREKSKRIRYNVNKLKDQTISKAYSDHLDAQLSEIEKNMKDCDLTEICSDFEQALTSSASEIIGKYRSKKQPWITDDILDLCDKRRTLKPKRKLNAESEHKYREINSKIRKMMLKAKEDWIQTQCKSIDDDMKHGKHNKRAYETLKMLTKQHPEAHLLLKIEMEYR